MGMTHTHVDSLQCHGSFECHREHVHAEFDGRDISNTNPEGLLPRDARDIESSDAQSLGSRATYSRTTRLREDVAPMTKTTLSFIFGEGPAAVLRPSALPDP
jgi:hypothetical protein